MSKPPDASRAERLKEFLSRLAGISPAADHDEAMEQIVETLNQVEDELTSIAYDPTFPLNDGRMYPPSPTAKGPCAGALM
jgi:hypothetical protein